MYQKIFLFCISPTIYYSGDLPFVLFDILFEVGKYNKIFYTLSKYFAFLLIV